jgi:hypothetical protein
MLRPCLLRRPPLKKPLWLVMVQPSVSGRQRTGLLWRNGSLGRRRSIRQRLPQLGLMLRALRRESPSLRVTMWRCVGPGKHLSGNTERVLRSSPSYKLRDLSCVTPLSVLLRHGICLRGCDTQPSDILRWPRSLPRFGLLYPLPQSRCLGAHPAIPSVWRW